MPGSYDLLVDGTVVEDFDTALLDLEIEESLDMPGAFRVTLPVKVTAEGDYDTVSDPRFGPMANIAVTAQAGDGQVHCLIDGYVLAHEIHLDAGAAASTLKISGQDASWLMNMTETVREWADVTDGAAANSIFGDYGFTPDAANLDEDSAAHTAETASLMQRSSDAQFLRHLAQRNGKFFRVFCTDTPGKRIGAFVSPKVDGAADVTLTLNPPDKANIGPLDMSWDVMRPSNVKAQQLLYTDPSGEAAAGDASDSGLADLDASGLSAFAARPVTALLTAPAVDAGTLSQRARSVLREAGWFVRATGTTDTGRLSAILRAGHIAEVEAAGALHSGKYLVWSVKHHITANAHEMAFVLMRNAVGTAPEGGLL